LERLVRRDSAVSEQILAWLVDGQSPPTELLDIAFCSDQDGLWCDLAGTLEPRSQQIR
jgi:hypothetical protein